MINYKLEKLQNGETEMNFSDWCYNMAGQPEPEYDEIKMEAK